MSPIDIAFYVLATLAITFSFLVVANRNPINSAFSLVMVFFCVAGVFVLQNAHLLAALQILVYAGAVMVLFIFVIMLLNADIKSALIPKKIGFQLAASALVVCLLMIFLWALKNGSISSDRGDFTEEKILALGGNTQVLSELLFSDFILPFELTSILLLVGIVGSVSLAKRKLEIERKK